MIPDALDFILRPVDEQQAEYAVASTKTSATPALSPRGVADTDSPAADVEGASASGAQTEQWVTVPSIANTPAPRWASVDDERGSFLDLLANEHPEIPSKAEEWETFVAVLKAVAAEHDGEIDQNETRPRLHGQVSPQRVGPMFRRARREGLIEVVDYTVTANSQSGNVGRPAPSYRWLGAAS